LQDISTAGLSEPPWVRDIPLGGQIDFQVQAIAGYVTRVYGTPTPPWTESYRDVFTGEKSGWSNTQTITVDANGSTSTPGSPSGTSTDLDQSGVSAASSQSDLFGVGLAVFVVLGVVGLIVVGAVLLRRKMSRQSAST
jgi:hypothetical protein